MIVHKQQARSGITCNVNVLPAVFVGIERNRRKTERSLYGCNTRFLGNIREGPVSIIAVKKMNRRRQSRRTAICGHAFVVAIRHLGGGLGQSGEVDIEIVRDEKIKPAIAVVIYKTTSRTKSSMRVKQAGLGGNVSKSA